MNGNYALQVPVVPGNIKNVNSCAIVTSSVTRAISYCDVILTDCSGPVTKDAMALLTKYISAWRFIADQFIDVCGFVFVVE